jgi:hypothetical protein
VWWLERAVAAGPWRVGLDRVPLMRRLIAVPLWCAANAPRLIAVLMVCR